MWMVRLRRGRKEAGGSNEMEQIFRRHNFVSLFFLVKLQRGPIGMSVRAR